MILFYILSGILIVIVSFVLSRLLPFKRMNRVISMGLLVMISYATYLFVGSLPELKQQKMMQHEQEKVADLLQSMNGKEGLINTLKLRLKSEPDSAQGHYLLAKLLASEGQWTEAVVHFDSARQVEPENVNYQVNYAFALWQLNNNQFNEEIRGVFFQILQQNPNQADALNMLAMDAYQHNNYTQAISYWRKLLNISPPGSKDAKIIEEAITKARSEFEKSNTLSI